MGQYFKIVNLDKAEYLDPFEFPFSGGKLGEFGPDLIMGFSWLLAKSDGRLMDDIIEEDEGENELYATDTINTEDVGEVAMEIATEVETTTEIITGRWAGDRILMIGDYDSSGLYQRLTTGEYRDISPLLLTYLTPYSANAYDDEDI